MFKSVYCANFKLLTKHTTSIKPTAIPLLVFGGEFFKNNKDSLLLCKIPSVFEVALSFNRNQDVWKD